MKSSRQVLVLTGLLVGCSAKESPVSYDPPTARTKIVAALPSGWTAIDANWQQQSDTTKFFNDRRTVAFMLVGPQSRHGYSESKGQEHREDIFKECIVVWIVPDDFTPTFPQLPPGSTMAITKIFSSRGVRVYADVANYITDTNRWQQMVNDLSTSTNGGSISQPIPRTSWKTWNEDIAAALNK